MARSVKVVLEADVGGFTVPIIGAREETAALDEKVKETNRDLDKVPPASTRAAAAMKALGLEAGKTRLELNEIGTGPTNVLELLDKKLEDTRAKVKQFAEDFNKTGSVDSFNLWKSATKDLGDLERFKKQFGGVLADVEKVAEPSGDKSGQSFTSKFVGVFGKGASGMVSGLANLPWAGAIFKPISEAMSSMPPQAQAAIGAGIAGAIIASSAFIGSALNGVLLGALGTGAIAGGIIGQIHDPAVMSALGRLKADLGTSLTQATQPFAPALVAATKLASSGFDDLMHTLAPAFAKLAPVFVDLVGGLSRGLSAAGPGLEKGLEGAAQILSRIAQDLPMLIRDFGIMFSLMSNGSQGASDAMHDLLVLIGTTAIAVGGLLQVLSQTFSAMEMAVDLATGNYQDFLAKLAGSGPSAKLAQDANKRVADSLVEQAQAAQQADQAWQHLHNSYLGATNASVAVKQTQADLAQALHDNGTSIDLNSEAGRKNVTAIAAQASANLQLRQSLIDSGQSAEVANQAYLAQEQQLYNTLHAAGLTDQQIQSLIGDWKSVPPNVGTKYDTPGLAGAIGDVTTYTRLINGIPTKITTSWEVFFQTGGSTGVLDPSQYFHGNRMGGIYEHAETGLLNAGIYSTRSPARYAFAEPATGGEAFVPRFGDYGRSTAILDQAARWYGGRFAAGGMGGGAVRVEMAFTGAAAGSLGSVIMGMVRTGEIQIRTSQLVSG